MKYLSLSLFFFISFFNAFSQEDEFGSRDIPYLPRLNGYYIDVYYSSDYDEFEFWTGTEFFTASGKTRIIHYTTKENVKPVGNDSIVNHYAKLLINMKAKLLFRGIFPGDKTLKFNPYIASTLKVRGKQNDLWFQVFASNSGKDYELVLVEAYKILLEIPAAQIIEELDVYNRVNIYINFDKNSIAISPESQKIVDQIALALQNKPELKLNIEGHTDNVGDNAENMKLSEERAKAVRDAVVAKGIAEDRLKFEGFGEDKPITTNDTEEGRARNRRIVLTKMEE